MENKVQDTSYFGDVEASVDFMKGFASFVNSKAQKEGGTYVSSELYERSIRKDVAKFYGNDSKYDGKGNKRTLPYAELNGAEKYRFGSKVNYYGILK